ncbi:MAG: DMT family transporter [Bryobacteraceae bacterium]|nr:DMT family transporter [Bryobacteraceae bacterium]
MISRGDLAIILATFIWGTSFVIVKDALSEVSTLLFLALRFALGSLAMALVLAPRLKQYSYPWRQMRWCLAGGLLLMGGMSLQTAGLRLTTISKSAFLTGLYIVLVPLLSSLVNRVGPRPREWLGIIFATAGMALMTMTKDLWQAPSLGDALTIGCAFVFAAHIMVTGEAARAGDPQVSTLVQLAVCAVGLAILGAAVETPRIVWSSRTIFAIILTGVFATALAIGLQSWAQQTVPATRAALLFALEPVFACFFAWAWAGEEVTPRAAAGAALILAGILVVELKPARFWKHQWSRAPLS